MKYKKHQVITLKSKKTDKPVNDLLKCIKSYYDSYSEEDFDAGIQGKYSMGVSHYMNEELYEKHHIYILSNDLIKEGDWCYDQSINNLFQVWNIQEELPEIWKKIIVTTDESLSLPLIPQTYIDYFIKTQSLEDINLAYDDLNNLILVNQFVKIQINLDF